MLFFGGENIQNILFQSWSIESSSKWTLKNPAKGHCGVTALVINDLYGGEILKTELEEGWHFYNEINGKRYDFIESQFLNSIEYMDVSEKKLLQIQMTNNIII